MKKTIYLGTILIFLAVLFTISQVNAQSALKSTVCCQETKSNLFCQNVPASECASNSKQAPTSCSTTEFCKQGVCYNPSQGTCADNVPEFVCNQNGGQWSAQSPPQCNLGCCVLGDQAAFVTLVRCKYLAGSLGLKTNYDQKIKDEVQCVLSVQNQDRGACVYESDFEKMCRFTTRSECLGAVNGTKSKGEFFKDKLCTAPELATKCERTTKTTCVPGKEEVYYVDNCGNPANIYDATKVNDLDYWTNVRSKDESCNPNSINANSKTCGNCNYLSGSVCRNSDSIQPTYGDAICADLNCEQTSNGKSYKHGESWCVYSDNGEKGTGKNSVGSRFYKHICINGEEVLEQCADFRQEECIQDSIEVPSESGFSQAACRVNRWQDCVLQTEQEDCENTDKRDCSWKAGYSATFSNSSEGLCLPKNSGGLKFWEGKIAKDVCARANEVCVVTFEKGLAGGKTCKSNCQCLTDEWKLQRQEICMAMGDCGPGLNWIGEKGYKEGFEIEKNKA